MFNLEYMPDEIEDNENIIQDDEMNGEEDFSETEEEDEDE